MININRIILRRKINHLLKDIKYSPFFFVCNYLPPFIIIVFSGKFITATTHAIRSHETLNNGPVERARSLYHYPVPACLEGLFYLSTRTETLSRSLFLSVCLFPATSHIRHSSLNVAYHQQLCKDREPVQMVRSRAWSFNCF